MSAVGRFIEKRKGALVGFGTGMLVFGPVGAIVGAVGGHYVVDAETEKVVIEHKIEKAPETKVDDKENVEEKKE